MIPGFPGGRLCPRCMVFWLALIVVLYLGYDELRRRGIV